MLNSIINLYLFRKTMKFLHYQTFELLNKIIIIAKIYVRKKKVVWQEVKMISIVI